MSEPRQFTNAQDAFAKGVEEGARDKQNGGLVDALDFNRELHEEGFKRQRGQRTLPSTRIGGADTMLDTLGWRGRRCRWRRSQWCRLRFPKKSPAREWRGFFGT